MTYRRATLLNCGKPLKPRVPNLSRKTKVAESNNLRYGKKLLDERTGRLANVRDLNGQSAAKPLRTQCQVYEEGSTTK
jgi:hypothetical protein